MRVAQQSLEQAPAAPQARDAAVDARRLAFLAPHWAGRGDYTILDTAFDFGERFFASRQAWRESSGRPRWLHYVALVPHFYSLAALEAAHRLWPQWRAPAQTLRERWPCAVPGLHRIVLPDADMRLTLVLGDDMQDLARIEARIDAFLAGGDFFARDAKRQGDGLKWFSRLAAAHARILLPSGEAGEIDERALRAAGFVREQGAPLASFAPRWQVDVREAVDRHAVVIGAGLAGAAVSERLCSRGWQVELIERHAAPAQEASGNLAGIVMPVIARDDNPVARFSRAAFLFALRLWREQGGVGSAFDGALGGVLQLIGEDGQISPDDYPHEFARLLEGKELAGTAHGAGRAWLFVQGGWVDPASLCRALLDACGDALVRHHGRDAAHLVREEGRWRVQDAEGAIIARAPHVVLANGIGGNRFAQSGALPLSKVRGQVTHVDAALLPPLTMALCGDGYVTPPWRGACSVGATYDDDDDAGLRQDSQRENLARLKMLFPQFAAHFDALPLQGRVGFRAVAPDRLPLIGALPDQAALALSRAERLRDVPRHEGLFALLGLASRGLTWAPLAAELLVAQMSGEPLPIERDLCATLDPARFALQRHRSAKKPRS